MGQNILHNDFNFIDKESVALNRDTLKLLTFQQAGHMGKWEYGPSLYKSDPAAGARLWEKMVTNAPDYYVSRNDTELVQWAVTQNQLLDRMKDVKNFVEFGPGSFEAVTEKTLPIIMTSDCVRSFIAVDISPKFAHDSAKIATEGMPVEGIGIAADFMEPLNCIWQGKSCYLILGSTISNMACAAGESGFHQLVSFFRVVRANMREGDTLLCTFDSCNDKDKVIDAYSGSIAYQHGINIAYRLKRDGVLMNDFNPNIWEYEPIWFSDTAQLCHTIYPIADQYVRIEGFDIRIPAYRQYVTNNSYKFSSEFVIWAAQTAGFSNCQVLYMNEASMLVADL